jgi:hypothetical protein
VAGKVLNLFSIVWDHGLLRPLILLSCLAATPLAAQPVKLTSDAIKTTIAGSQLELDTPLGTTVSVRFNRDGLMSGDAKELASLLGAAKDRGRWWVASDQLCYKWFRWFDAEPRCLAITQEAKRIFWQRDDGENGTATIVEQGTPPEKPAIQISVVAQGPKLQGRVPREDARQPEIRVPAGVEIASASDTSPRLVQTSQDAQIVSSPRAAKLSTKTTRSAIKTRSIAVASVPAPRPAVRPKAQTHLVAATPPPPHTDAQLFAKSDIKSFRVAGVEPSDVLNIRNGPSEDDDAVGVIPPTGRGITIIGSCLEDWCPINHLGHTGWVNRYYLAEDVSR